MEAHTSQMKTRNYVDLQVARARVHGLSAGVEYAQPLFPADAIVVGSLAVIDRTARRF
jgi:N-acetylglucosamine malate deacetylase 1